MYETQTKENFPYVIYARKSSESEDRQVLSIDSQIIELKDLAHHRALNVIQTLTEARSAKTIGRPVFNTLLQGLLKGQYAGILCWKLDRLARNPVDGAQLIQTLEAGRLKHIVTPGQTYTNTTNDKFSLAIELCLAKRYVDDLSDNVKRGNRAKLEQGWLPGSASLGYLNDRQNKIIVKDPVRFDVVRKIWDMLLTENMTVPKVLEVINRKFGLRTRRTRKTGDKPLSRSGLYRMLGNPFYYGLIVRNGESFQGAHPPMITKEEFDRVQEILGRPGKPKYIHHYFPFTGLIRCGECGAMITAEERVNRYGSRYVYYHCTKRLGRTRCSQSYIRAEDLERQMLDALQQITISDEFRDWAIKRLRKLHQQEAGQREILQVSADKAYQQCQKRLDNLLELRLRELVNDEEYQKRKRSILDEMAELKEKKEDIEGRQSRWFELSERAFIFANQAKNWFDKGTPQRKREIIACLGSNFTLKDKILLIEAKKPFLKMQEGRDKSRWLTTVDYVRTFFCEGKRLFSIPLCIK